MTLRPLRHKHLPDWTRGNNRAHDTPSGLGVIHELDSGRRPLEPSRLRDILSPTLELSRPSVAIRRMRWSDYQQQGCDGNTGLDHSRPHALLPLGLGWRYADLMTFTLFPWRHYAFHFYHMLSFHPYVYPCFIFSSIFDLSHGCACHCCIITNSSHDLFFYLWSFSHSFLPLFLLTNRPSWVWRVTSSVTAPLHYITCTR